MMKKRAPALGLAILLALTGCAEQPAANSAQPAASKTVCLPTYMIDRTTIPDDSTILFHMRDGKVWKNSLPYPCVGLKIQNGFAYVTSIDEICSNLQTIRVLREQTVCMLGAFTPFEPAK
jgi:hypothetical protein